MKYKLIVCISVLAIILNIGFAQLSQNTIDKKAMQPGKPNAADVLTVTNNFYDLIVENSTSTGNGVGTFTVRTGTSHPATIAMSGVKQNVLYGGQYGSPWSSYLTVKSYTSNTNYHTGGYPTPDTGCSVIHLDMTVPTVTQPTSTSILCNWNVIGENDFLNIRQRTFIDGTTLDDSKIGVTTTVKNIGSTPVRIGIRYEWDIMIDNNDGSVMRTKNPEGPWQYNETQWSAFPFTHYEITNHPASPVFYNLGSVTGPTYLTPPPTSPDILTFADWGNSYSRAFNYNHTGQYMLDDDSAILYYWGNNLGNSRLLAAGDSVMVTQYLFASLLTINYRVDNLIKNSTDASYIGDNIYNLNGVDQTKTQSVIPGNTAIYHIKIENDGSGQDGFNIQEVVSDDDDLNWNVQYYDALTGGNNITTQVTGSGWNTGGLNPGQFKEIRLEVTGRPMGSQLHTFLMSTSQNDNTKKDVVCAITNALPYHDVGANMILAPVGSISAGTIVTPKVIVENFGNFNELFQVGFHFFGYGDTQVITALLPGAVDTIEFDNWTAVAGSYLGTAYTMMVTDQNPSNNTTYTEFSVTGQTVYDVGATQILAPLGIITSGTSVTPRAVIQNFGNTSASGYVVFSFYTYYSTRSYSLSAGQIDTVEFDSWTAAVGAYNEWAHTYFGLDQNPYNDTVRGEFTVIPSTIHDVGATQILAPIGNLFAGASVTPRAVLHNFGNVQESSVPVYFTFGTYSSNRTVSLAIGQTDTVDFDPWTATAGNFTGTAYTALETDISRYNDTTRYRFSVTDTGVNDISIVALLEPTTGTGIVTCNDYTPAVVVRNQSITGGASPCSLLMRITRYPARMDSFCNIGVDLNNPIVLYEEWIYSVIAVGYDTFYLPDWHPYWSDITWIGLPTYHSVYTEVFSPNDSITSNNSLSSQFTVDGSENDLQMNWTGLLDGYLPLHQETLEIRTYNVASVVSNPVGPTAEYRSKVRIIKDNDSSIVYARYLDEEIEAGTYSCLSYQSGFTPDEPGWYKVASWLETRPGIDVIIENNAWEKWYYFTNTIQPPQAASSTPATFGSLSAKPSPFSDITNISWQIPINASVKLVIYDATGRTVKTLVNSDYQTGYYNTSWNRTDDNNQKVPAGVYFYELRANNNTARQKLVIR